MTLFDCLIVGGGYAGLSAAIYIARYNRSVLIINKGSGRWDNHELNENYLGFPDGVSARELRERGLLQAFKFGAEYITDEVIRIKKNRDIFTVQGRNDVYQGKTIILATGVQDLFPRFTNWREYVGRSLFWCLTCDGFKTLGKKVAIVGQDDEAAIDALQFLNFTRSIIFITNVPPGKDHVSQKQRFNLKRAGISFHEGKIVQVFGQHGMFEKIRLSTGQEIVLDFMFNEQGSIPNSKLAKDMKVKLNKKGYILTDNEQRTNIPFVYAAGDVTKPFANQIITAAHEGSAAAESANYDLYRPEQKED